MYTLPIPSLAKQLKNTAFTGVLSSNVVLGTPYSVAGSLASPESILAFMLTICTYTYSYCPSSKSSLRTWDLTHQVLVSKLTSQAARVSMLGALKERVRCHKWENGWLARISVMTMNLTAALWHMLTGCQVCNWGIQYHLCSTNRGLWGLSAVVAQWQSTGGAS